MIIQYIIVILLGSWSLYYIIKKFRVKKKPTSNKSCSKGCASVNELLKIYTTFKTIFWISKP